MWSPPVNQRSAGLRLQRCAGCGGAQRRTLDASADCSVPTQETWTRDVGAANALKGDERRDTMATLVQRALCGTGRRIAIAGNSHTDRVDQDDYEKIPVINFDINLNEKKGSDGRKSLAGNFGYSFDKGADKYAVLGPKVLDAASPVHVKMRMEHEIYHTEHHLDVAQTQQSDEDEELETYTADFLRYFHQLIAFRAQWAPLIDFYDRASASARARSLDRLAAYHDNPPVQDAEKARIRAAFERWLRRRLDSSEHRNSRLIQDLAARIPLGSAAGTP
jgi:hypothetical protein